MNITLTFLIVSALGVLLSALIKIRVDKDKIEDLESDKELLSNQRDVYKDQIAHLMKERNDLLEDNEMLRRLNEQYLADAYAKEGFVVQDEEPNKEIITIIDDFVNDITRVIRKEVEGDL